MRKSYEQTDKREKKLADMPESFLKSFLSDFSESWKRFDHDFDEMDKRIRERKKLNGKATNHEIDL